MERTLWQQIMGDADPTTFVVIMLVIAGVFAAAIIGMFFASDDGRRY